MEEEIEAGMDQINMDEEQEVRRRKLEGRCVLLHFATVFFSVMCGVCIFALATNWNNEVVIPVLMSCLVFLGICIYYTIRGTVSACNPRSRTRRVAVRSQDVEDTDENGSSSSPAPLVNPDVAGPSGLQASDSSTSSVQSTTLESGEKTSSSESKCTFTTTAVVESVDKISEVASSISQIALETVASKKEENVQKPFTNGEKRPDDCLTEELATEKEHSGPVRQRRPTPESQKDKIPE